MKTALSFLCVFLYLHSFSQILIDGTSSNLQVINNGPAVFVDEALTVQTALSIPAFRVTISTNYNPGDILSFDNATKPVSVSSSFGGGVLTFTGVATAAQYQSLLRTVQLNTTSTNALARTITFEAGNGTLKYFNGHFYRVVSGSYSWTTAKTNVLAENFFGWQGYLTTITSSGENTFVYSVGKGWIGASDAVAEGGTENIWKWVTGPESGTQFSTGTTVVPGRYASWNGTEPNNTGGNEHYAENSSPNNGNWNDATNTTNTNYLVEFGDLPAGVAVDIFHSRNITMVATKITTAAPTVPYELHAPPVAVDPSVTVYTASNFIAGKATISGNFKTGDLLSFSGTLPGTFTSNYNNTTGVLSFATTGTVTAMQWQNLFQSIKFSSSSNVKGNRDVTFSLGNQVAFSNGHFYEYIAATSNWPTARTNVLSKTYLGLQGYITTITSREENDFIKQTLSADAWIGASDDYRYINDATGVTTYSNQAAAEGKWYWVTGPEKGLQITTGNAPNGTSLPPPYMTTFNYWTTGEPNNFNDGSTTENVAEIYTSASNPGLWNDNRETQARGYVAEYGGLSADPLLFLSANRTMSIDIILPATSLEFDAVKSNLGAELKWSTRTETNTDYYLVQHSTDGTNFNDIKRVKAAENSNGTRSYRSLHTSPVNGVNYYRLKQFDRDARFVYSHIKLVTLDLTMVNIRVAPNPATNKVVVSFPFKGETATLKIYSASGEVIFNTIIKERQTFVDVSNFKPGTYVAEIRQGNQRESAQFVKQL